ncbi:MAG: M20 family metallopeptidase [Nitrososphaerales archaeon]
MPHPSPQTCKHIFSKIDSAEAAELVQDMVRIPSLNPPGEEAEVAEYIAEKMREIGLEVEAYDCIPRRPNVIGRLKGEEGHPTLMLNGHLDVVPPGNTELWTVAPFGGELRGGRVYGRGSADMKGGLAAMLLAAKALKESAVSLKGDLLLTAVVDEEVTGRGARDLIHRGYTADMAVVAEPTELKPVRAHKGLVWFEISTVGRALHSSRVSSRSTGGEVNAIYKMAKVLEVLQAYLLDLEKRADPLVGNPTVSVGTITGGSKTNIVPDRCSITVDRRLLPGESPDDAKAEVEDILRRLSEEDQSLKTVLKVILSRESAVTSIDEPVVTLSKEAVEEVLGTEVEVSGSPATSDMEVFVNQASIPTVLLGPGRLGTAHITDEYVEVEQVVAAAKIFAVMAMKVLG